MKRYLNFLDGRKCELSNIYAVASNYKKHADEMGTTIPDEPTIFLKPTSAYISDGGTILLPKFSNEIHHEVELVVVIGKDGNNVSEEDAVNYIAGYAVGIDVTLRDTQTKAKKEGKPWGIAKGFYTSAPISSIVPATEFNGNIPDFDLLLKVNGEIRQSANTRMMERSVAQLVSFISKVFSLNEGDCIFTGTPEGVGKIQDGDTIFAELVGFVSLTCFVANKLEG
ncbi:MAG: fumarylacetoacetate hydrolase family protein [Ignavibacteria bacterium]|nr:fumarylacetoacetate hydrolase family protein [Ignavibacteria bacterium]